MRLLCVEDEASLREDMVEYLRMQSYEVDEAASGEDAIEQLNRHQYDLVLCDIKMPRMDGYELLKQVRQENNLARTPFIFLSALNERDDKMRAHQSGCDGYLTKPIDFSLLDVTLKSHIERQRARDFVYSNTLEATRKQMMSVIDDALNGPISEACLVVQHLRDTLPVLTPSALDSHLADLQDNVAHHAVSLHAVHSALQLQVAAMGLHTYRIPVEELIRESVSECNYHYPLSPVSYVATDTPIDDEVTVDARLMQRAIAGLLAPIAHAGTSKDLVSFRIEDGHWLLTVSDHHGMTHDSDYIPLDESHNLSALSNATRKRLVPLMFAMQVAHAHGGRIEVKLWPGDYLAVRFVMPQTIPGRVTA